jgi:hypothetical protein
MSVREEQADQDIEVEETRDAYRERWGIEAPTRVPPKPPRQPDNYVRVVLSIDLHCVATFAKCGHEQWLTSPPENWPAYLKVLCVLCKEGK